MSSRSVFCGVVLAAAISGVSSSALAAPLTASGKVAQIGCHLAADQCYVEIAGWGGGYPGCPSNSIRWNGSTDVGRMHFSYFMAMYLSGKPVTIVIDGCFWQNYPTFSYYSSR